MFVQGYACVVKICVCVCNFIYFIPYQFALYQRHKFNIIIATFVTQVQIFMNRYTNLKANVHPQIQKHKHLLEKTNKIIPKLKLTIILVIL